MSDSPSAEVGQAAMGDDLANIAEYRPLSTLAIVSAIAGLLSPIAVLSPSLMAIPVVGVALSLLALQRIHARGDEMVGRNFALVGLTLSVLIGSFLLARNYTRHQALAQQALPCAERWCDLVQQGRLLEAIELTHAPNSRRPLDTLETYYNENESAAKVLEEFRIDPVVLLLKDAPEGAEIRFVGADRFYTGVSKTYVLVEAFALDLPAENGKPGKTREFSLELQRDKDVANTADAWFVSGKRMGRPAADG